MGKPRNPGPDLFTRNTDFTETKLLSRKVNRETCEIRERETGVEFYRGINGVRGRGFRPKQEGLFAVKI
jgi:hypothetical protein